MEWDPLKRLTPDDALNHPWILDGIKSLMGPEGKMLDLQGAAAFKFPRSFLPPILNSED